MINSYCPDTTVRLSRSRDLKRNSGRVTGAIRAVRRPHEPEPPGWHQEEGMSERNHPQPDIDEADGPAHRPKSMEQGDGSADGRTDTDTDTDTATRWEDGTAMPYWVAPDDAQGQG